MAHSFSTKSLKDMEYIFDRHIAVLRRRLDGFANSGEVFDLKEAMACFAYDVIGELAFSTQFESQKATSQDKLPPIAEHALLGCMIGIMSGLLPYSKTIVTWLPIPWVRHLINSRAKLRNQTLDCVNAAMVMEEGNPNLLTHLIQAKDPDTGADLTKADICSEAFGFLYVLNIGPL
jgi:benzoate 4-monooxygenase